MAEALPVGDDIPDTTMDAHTNMLLTPMDLVAVKPDACQPIADTMNFASKHKRVNTVWATGDVDTPAAPGMIVLTSFTAKDAIGWMTDLKAALSH